MNKKQKDYISKFCELDECKKKFTVNKNCKRDNNRKYCSKFCATRSNGLKNKGKKRTEEFKKYLSEINSGEKNKFYGKIHSEEAKEKISKKNTGKKRTEEVKQKMSEIFSGENNPFYGKKHSDESRAKISQNHADHSGEKNPNYGNGEKLKGENNPSWLGGISYEDYGLEFSEELKTKIRKRDFFRCNMCEENGYDVHHIDYDKKNNFEQNLITLCRSCHAKTNFNRDNWKLLLESLMRKKYE